MSHGSPIPLGAFETPDIRLARLRTQFQSTTQSFGDTVTDLVDLEARRRAMEENLRRFREVEQQQNLQFPSPVQQTRAGTFTTGEITTPEQQLALSAPPSPVEVEQRLREGGPGLGGLLSGVPTSPEELARVLGRRVAETGVPARGIEEFETRVARPFGASALQIVESPAGGGILGATELKGLQRRAEELGVPEEVSPLPRERTFAESLEAGGGAVNPFAALIGDKEEQEKALAVLEEAGLPRALAFEVIFDITNLAPGVGLTRVAPFARALKVAVGATGRTRQAAVAALRNSDVVKDALRAGERGGPLRGGEEVAGVQNLAFHETSPRTAIPILQEGKFGSVGPMGVRFDVATSRELALGQRGKGAKVILDFDALTARPIQKPGTPLVGQQEFSVTNQAGRPVLAVDFDPNALDRVTKRFIDNLRDLDPARIQDLPDGSIRVFAKNRAPAPPLRGGEEGLAAKWRRMVEEIDNLTPEQQVREFGVSGDAAYSRAGFGRLFTGMGDAADTARITRQIKAAGSNRAFILQQADKAEASAARAAGPATPPLRGGEGVPPPREPLPPSDLPPPLDVPPERGQAGAEALLSTKEETLLRPGPVTKFPGVKQAASGLNPSVTTDREILVAYNARQAAASSLETEFAAARQSPLDELRAIFRDDPPRYTGPEDNPFKNTLKDWGDNPEHYVLTERHLAAARAYDDVGSQTLARAAGEFGVKVEPFPVKEGGFFTPTVATKESLDAAVKNVSDGYTSAAVTGKGARTKTRVFEGAYQRWLNNADFRAETDLAELTGLHDRAMSTLAGNQTFKIGSGGLSRLELMEQLHPALFTRMTGLRTRLASLQGTAGRLNKKLGTAIDEFLSAPDDIPLADLADALDVTVTRGARKGANVKAINAEIRSTRQTIRQLRPAWDAANLEPYVLNRQTFQFHLPEQSEAIDSILRTKLNIGQGFADVIDEVRLTAFAADVSPLTIQGLLGGLSHPLITASNTRNIVRSLWNPDELLKIATREPELVERFTVATGRPFGEVGPEFVQKFKGIERARIPFTDLRPGRALNRRLMAAVEEIRYSAWKTDQDLIRKFNPEMTQNVADAEAANFLSKMIPALNPAETGRSVLRARFERIPIISTSFLSAPPALLKDMASGLAKLGLNTKLSPIARWQLLSGREQLSLLRGLNLAGSISALTVGSYVASGFSIEDAVKKTLDPTGNNPRFLSIALGKDRFIPIGGPVRSFVRGIIPEKVGEVKGVPLYLPFVNTKKWLLGKVTPAIKAPIDIARDKDFFGGNIATGSFPENILRAVWYGVNSVLPLSVAEPSEAIRRGEIEPTDFAEISIRGGGQFAGSDVRELRLREAFERETGRSFAETPSALRRQIIADSPLLTRLAEQQEVFFPDEGKRIRAERSTELLPHAQAALGGGLEAVRAYNDNRKFIMAKFGGVSEEVFKDLDIEPKGRDNELLSQYYEVDFRADHNGNGIPGDDEDVRLALEEQDNLKSQMSPAVQAALNNPENFFVDREVIEYEGIRREGVDAIRDILNLPKWTGLTLEEGNTLDDLVSRINADVQRYKAQAVRDGDSADSVTFRNTAEWLRDRGAISALDAENAIAVSSGIAIREQGRINLALDRRDVLLQTFPDFFGSVLPAEVEREQLTGEEIEQLQPVGIP